MTTRPNSNTIRGAKPKNPVRIQRPCMPQPIRGAMTTMMANNCNNNYKPRGGSTWDGLLSARSKEKSLLSSSLEESYPPQQLDQISMLLFDPLHVLKFLFSELKTKLKLSLPDDKNVYKILSEIQQTMKRVGAMSSKTPFTASSSNLVVHQENQEYRVKRFNSSCQTDKCIFSSMLFHEKGSQTDVEFGGLDRFSMETQIKKSHEKLKENCDALEKACAALQDEKYSIHTELCKCRDEIGLLKTELSYLQSELKEATSREKCTTQELEEQCKRLQDELKSLQNFLSKQKVDLAAVESLSGKLKESSEKISLLEKSRLENDKILVFTKMEKEKLMVLQKFRENQMESLQRDIAEVYKLIKEQLAGIQYGIEVGGGGGGGGGGGAGGAGDGGNSGGAGSNRNRKSSLGRKSLERTKIESSSTPSPPPPQPPPVATATVEYHGGTMTTTASNTSENQLRPQRFAKTTKMRKTHREQRSVKSLPSANVPDAAYDLFVKESITLNDRFPDVEGEEGNGTEQSSSSPPRTSSPFLVKKERKLEKHPFQDDTRKSHNWQASSGTSQPHRREYNKKHFHENTSHHQPLLHDYLSKKKTNADSGETTTKVVKPSEQLKYRETTPSVPSEFDEFKKLLDDVIPPSPPRKFKKFSLSSSADVSFDLTPGNSSSNEQ